MASHWYNNALELLLLGDLHMDTDDLRIMIVTSTETFAEADVDVADVVANESGLSGYARQQTNVTVAQDDSIDGAWVKIQDTNDEDITFDAMPAGEIWGAAILYHHVSGTDADCPLIAFLDIADTTTNGSDITLDFATSSPGNLKLVRA